MAPETSKIENKIKAYEADVETSSAARAKHVKEVDTLSTRILQLQGAIFALKELVNEAPPDADK